MNPWVNSLIAGYTLNSQLTDRLSGLVEQAWSLRPHGWVLDSGGSGPGSGPGQGHCVVFLGKTLYSNGASLYPGV